MQSDDSAIPERSTDDATMTLIKIISDCPAWSDVDADEKVKKEVMLQHIHRLSLQETDALRNTIQDFVRDRQKSNTYSVDEMSKLFLLNRYALNVPKVSQLKDARFFGGWVGVPHDDQFVDLLWPFDIDENGHVQLIGRFGGYNGDDFQAVEEFDHLLGRFGRRLVEPASPEE